MPTRLLVTEGEDDLHAIGQLCARNAILLKPKSRDFDCLATGGIEKLLQQLPTLLEYSADLVRMAIVVDANSNPAGRWQSFRDRLNELGIPSLPHDMDEDGVILQLSQEFRPSTLGIWMMPDNLSGGELESFLLSFVTRPDLLPHVDAFLDGIPIEVIQSLPIVKARVHAYLAVQSQPGRRLGEAIKFGYFDPKGPLVDRFLNWFRSTLDC